MATVEGHGLARQERGDDFGGLGQALLAHCRRVENHPHGRVLGEAVPGAETDLEPAATQAVEGGQLLGQGHRMVQVVVEHQRAESDARGRDRGGGQRDERRALAPDVVTHLEDVEAGVLGRLGRAHHFERVVAVRLKAEAKATHLGDPTECIGPRHGPARGAGPWRIAKGPRSIPRTLFCGSAPRRHGR